MRGGRAEAAFGPTPRAHSAGSPVGGAPGGPLPPPLGLPQHSWIPPGPPAAEDLPQGSLTLLMAQFGPLGTQTQRENEKVRRPDAMGVPGRLPRCGACPPGLPSQEGGRYCPCPYFTSISGRWCFWRESSRLFPFFLQGLKEAAPLSPASTVPTMKSAVVLGAAPRPVRTLLSVSKTF